MRTKHYQVRLPFVSSKFFLSGVLALYATILISLSNQVHADDKILPPSDQKANLTQTGEFGARLPVDNEAVQKQTEPALSKVEHPDKLNKQPQADKKPAAEDQSKPRATGRTTTTASPALVMPGRYVPVFLAWVDEPYIAYRVLPDPYTGTFVTVPVVRYNRRMVQVYLDRLTNTYGYLDMFGNPVPYKAQRYRWGDNPF